MQIYLVLGIGVIALIAMLVLIYLNGTAGEFIPIIAGVCTVMGLLQYIRVKREVESMGRSFTWKL